jgi:hypothetical protein
MWLRAEPEKGECPSRNSQWLEQLRLYKNREVSDAILHHLLGYATLPCQLSV